MIDYESLKKDIRIIDYAIEIGMTPVKVGSRYYTLKEHDSVRIDPVKNIFIQNSTGKAGSIIDFAMCFTGKTFNQAVSELVRRPSKDKSSKLICNYKKISTDEKQKFILPKADRSMKNVFAYLTKTRKISPMFIQELIDRKQLYQDIYKNCVFVSYRNGRAVFACRRGTNINKRFVGDVVGSDYSFLFFIVHNAARLVISESVIDTLSLEELLSINEENGYKKYDYLALCGCSKFKEALYYHLGNKKYEEIWICLDKDSAGIKNAENIRKLINSMNYKTKIRKMFPLNGKDFNDELRIMKEK